MEPYCVLPVYREGAAGPSRLYPTHPAPFLLPHSPAVSTLLLWLLVPSACPGTPYSYNGISDLMWPKRPDGLPHTSTPDLPSSSSSVHGTSLSQVSEAREPQILPCLLFPHPLLPATSRSGQPYSQTDPSSTIVTPRPSPLPGHPAAPRSPPIPSAHRGDWTMSHSCISSTGHSSKRAGQRGVGPARRLWPSPPLSPLGCPGAPAAPFFSNMALLPRLRPWHQPIPAQTALP